MTVDLAGLALLPEKVRARLFITANGECWLWTGGHAKAGYGSFTFGRESPGGRRTVPAHRLTYEALVGPIPEGLVIDHLCRNRGCVNPEHLEPVTFKENVLRGVGPTAENAVKTHCKRDHAFTPENTYVASGGGRGCRACRDIYNATNWQRYRNRSRSTSLPSTA